MATLEKAIAIAVQAHSGQRDRAGEPYILHPLRVMMRCRTATARIVAVLHDVLEDTAVTADALREAGFSEEVLAALDCVTKREGEGYEAFVERAAGNTVAREVKLADLADNMDVTRLGGVSEKDCARLDRYVKAWHRLQRG